MCKCDLLHGLFCFASVEYCLAWTIVCSDLETVQPVTSEFAIALVVYVISASV